MCRQYIICSHWSAHNHTRPIHPHHTEQLAATAAAAARAALSSTTIKYIHTIRSCLRLQWMGASSSFRYENMQSIFQYAASVCVRARIRVNPLPYVYICEYTVSGIRLRDVIAIFPSLWLGRMLHWCWFFGFECECDTCFSSHITPSSTKSLFDFPWFHTFVPSIFLRSFLSSFRGKSVWPTRKRKSLWCDYITWFVHTLTVWLHNFRRRLTEFFVSLFHSISNTEIDGYVFNSPAKYIYCIATGDKTNFSLAALTLFYFMIIRTAEATH